MLVGGVPEIAKPVFSGIGISLSCSAAASRVDELDECWGIGAASSMGFVDANVSRSKRPDILVQDKRFKGSDQPRL